jgi:hypothetical protein
MQIKLCSSVTEHVCSCEYKACSSVNLNGELNDLCSSPNIIRVIKSRRMGGAGHVAHMGEREVHTGLWWGHLRDRDHLGDPGIDGRIILKWTLKKWAGA